MEHTLVFNIIDQQVGELEQIAQKNTVLVPGVLASIATLKDLKRRVEESIEQIPEPQNQGI